MKQRKTAAISFRYLPKFRDTDFYRLYNIKDEKSRGRAMILANVLMCSIGNIFISGTFQTAFLASNGIDIVRVGIITFLPYFCSLLSLLAPKILSKFPRRRWILTVNHFNYFTCIVLATTIMPMFVEDPDARTFWFAFFLLLGNGANALIGSGTTAWSMMFLPEGRDRNFYFSVSNIVTNVLGTVTAIGASLAADALTGSPKQAQIITVLRLVSFVIMMIGGCLQLLVPKEYPYETSTGTNVRLRDVLTIPGRNRKFLLTVIVGYIWTMICSVNSATWVYYLLDTVKLPYVMTYISSIVTAVGCIFLLPMCRRIYHRYGWHKVMLVNVITVLILDCSAVFITAKTIWIYVLYSVLSGLNLVCMQLSTSNTFYLNVPKQDVDHYVIFNSVVSSVAALAGSIYGTWFLSVTERPDGGPLFAFIGLDFYPSQMLAATKLVMLAAMVVYIIWATPRTQPDKPAQ